MKTFNAILTSICSMACGMNLMAGKWIAAGITALGAAYWFAQLVKTEKKVEKEIEVKMTDSARELLQNKGIKVVVNGKEII